MALSYFNESVGGVEQLWVTDGTPQGTCVVTSLGNANTDPIANLTAIGARIFFSLDDVKHGNELWTSDGQPRALFWSRTLILAGAAQTRSNW